MRTLFLLLATTCAGLSIYGACSVSTLLHSPGDDNPFAMVGAFFFLVGGFGALLATGFKATRA